MPYAAHILTFYSRGIMVDFVEIDYGLALRGEASIAGQSLSFLLVDRPDYVSHNDLAAALWSKRGDTLVGIDLIIVREPVDQAVDGTEIGKLPLDDLKVRAADLGLHILTSNNFEIILSENLNPAASDFRKISRSADLQEITRLIRQSEMTGFILHNRAVFSTADGFVLRAPSERYVRSFLRVGSIQVRRPILDAVFFWLLPYLKECDAILVETWSISSIALNSARLVQRYSARSHPRCRIDMLAEYHDAGPSTLPVLRAALQRVTAGNPRKILLLTSASMTQKSLARLRHTIQEFGYMNEMFSFVTLYKLTDIVEIPALCDLANHSTVGNFQPEAVDFSPPSGTQVIDIDRHTYFPTTVHEKPLDITIDAATPARVFFDNYRNTAAFSLHRDSFEGEAKSRRQLRHHAFYIDVEALLANPEFCGKVRALIGEIRSFPKAIIAPPHSAGTRLSSFCSDVINEIWGRRPLIYVNSDLSKPDEIFPIDQTSSSRSQPLLDFIRSASESDSIVIVDDVIVTGARMASYREALRRYSFQGKIAYIVGVARPSDPAKWRKLKFELEIGKDGARLHSVKHAEFVVLPNWGRERCPWCNEGRAIDSILRTLQATDPAHDEFASRLNELTRAPLSSGLSENAIWVLPNTGPVDLTPESIFVTSPAPTAVVMAAVASAIQTMRRRDTDCLTRNYPFMTVLSTHSYLETRFTDPILRVAVLRCAAREELRRSLAADEIQRARDLLSFLEAYPNHIRQLRREMGLALYQGNLPTTQELATARVLLTGHPPDPVADTFASLVFAPATAARPSAS